MFVFRSLSLGLLGACFLLLATRPAIEVRVRPPTPASVALAQAMPRELAVPGDATPTIIDVAPGITATQLASLVRLGGGEQITTIDEMPVPGDLAAGAVLATLDLRARRYIDLSVSGPDGPRRVLVLLH